MKTPKWIPVFIIANCVHVLGAPIQSSSQPADTISERECVHEQDSLLPGGLDVSGVTGDLYFGTIQCHRQPKGWDLRFLVQVEDKEGRALRSLPLGETTLEMRTVLPGLFPCVKLLPNGDVVALIDLDRRTTSMIRVADRGAMRYSTPLWVKKGEHSARFWSVLPAPEDDVIALGQVNGKPAMARVNRQGEVVLHQVLKDMGDGFCSGGVARSDRDFVVCGLSSSSGGASSTAWVLRMDAQGNSQKAFRMENSAPPTCSLTHSYAVEVFENENIAFVFPVIDPNGSNWHLMILDRDLKVITDMKLVPFDGIAPWCSVRQADNGMAIMVGTSIRGAALLTVSPVGKVIQRSDAVREKLLQGRSWLAVRNGIAYILAQKGWPDPKAKSTVRLITVRDLKPASP